MSAPSVLEGDPVVFETLPLRGEMVETVRAGEYPPVRVHAGVLGLPGDGPQAGEVHRVRVHTLRRRRQPLHRRETASSGADVTAEVLLLTLLLEKRRRRLNIAFCARANGGEYSVTCPFGSQVGVGVVLTDRTALLGETECLCRSYGLKRMSPLLEWFELAFVT